MRALSVPALFVIMLLLTAVPAPASETESEASLTIRLTSTPGRIVERDLPPKGELSRGDTLSGTSILRNAVAQFGKPKGALVGTDSYVMTITKPPRALIKVQAKLPGGTLRVQGHASVTKGSITIPVVGGTGRFAGARGTSEARGLSGGRCCLNVYRLRLP